MKVATRITVATAVVVAIASSGYALFDLRERTSERRMELEREARGIASTLRMALEAQASAYPDPERRAAAWSWGATRAGGASP